MNIIQMIISEIQYSRKNFLLGVVTISAVSATLLAMILLSGGYDRYAECQALGKENATIQHMNRVVREYKMIASRMGFTIRILPAQEKEGDFYTEGYAQQTMPLGYVDSLCKVAGKEVITVVSIFRQKRFWQEQNRSILLASTGPTELPHADTSRFYGYKTVPAGRVALGYELHNSNGFKNGDRITIQNRPFVVEQCMEPRGSIDDITAWLHYNDLQPIVDIREMISEIWIWTDSYSMKEHEELVQQIKDILPSASVNAVMPPATMKANAIATAAQVATIGIHKEKEHHHTQLLKRKRLLFIISGIVLLVTILFVSSIMFANSMARIKEIGVFSALGYPQSYIVKIFIGRAFLVVSIGGVLGSLIGTLIGVLGTALFWHVYVFDIGVFSKTIAVIIICGIVAGILPALLAIRNDPARVLTRE